MKFEIEYYERKTWGSWVHYWEDGLGFFYMIRRYYLLKRSGAKKLKVTVSDFDVRKEASNG